MSKEKVLKTDVLVIGSGIAGLHAAIEAKKYGVDVLLVDKSVLARASITTFSGGQIMGGFTVTRITEKFGPQAYDDNPNSLDRIFEKNVRREWGLPYCRNELFDEIVAIETHPRGDESAEYGVENPRYTKKYAPINRGGWPHIGPLVDYCKKVGIKTRKGFFVIDLIRQNGTVVGVVGLDQITGALVTINAKAVILATGGHAECWERNNTPWVATGDGQAMAYRLGCKLKDMEAVQYDSWIIAEEGLPQFWIKISYARTLGELCNKNGEAFLKNYFPDEIMINPTFDPKDPFPIRYGMSVLDKESFRCRGMAVEVMQGRGDRGAVFADFTPVPEEEWLKDPIGISTYNILGDFDWKKNWVHVAPGALGCWGGVKHNEYCETDFKGLYAAGEVGYVCHLRDSLVFGARAGAAAGRYARFNPLVEVDKDVAGGLIEKAEGIRNRPPNDDGDPREVKKLIKRVMMKYVGVLRWEKGLKKGLEELRKIRTEKLPKLYATNPIQLRHALEAMNMVETGELVARASLMRKDSRGVHNRIDFPFTDHENWTKNTVIYKDPHTGEPELDTEPVVKTRGAIPKPEKIPIKGMPESKGDNFEFHIPSDFVDESKREKPYYVKLKTLIDEDKCVFCLDCVLACPVEVIDADYEREKAIVVNQVECISCLNCEEVCPTKAIRVEGAVRKDWKAPPIKWDMWGPAELKKAKKG
ncbi:MAG: FAD-binding protein [Deltaproteobacteria bacterium]|nr:FAD-binding protein [Deltaproteobacteria bacterium]